MVIQTGFLFFEKKNEKSRKAIKWCMYNLLQQKRKTAETVLETVYCKRGRKKSNKQMKNL